MPLTHVTDLNNFKQLKKEAEAIMPEPDFIVDADDLESEDYLFSNANTDSAWVNITELTLGLHLEVRGKSDVDLDAMLSVRNKH